MKALEIEYDIKYKIAELIDYSHHFREMALQYTIEPNEVERKILLKQFLAAVTDTL